MFSALFVVNALMFKMWALTPNQCLVTSHTSPGKHQRQPGHSNAWGLLCKSPQMRVGGRWRSDEMGDPHPDLLDPLGAEKVRLYYLEPRTGSLFFSSRAGERGEQRASITGASATTVCRKLPLRVPSALWWLSNSGEKFTHPRALPSPLPIV